MNENLSKVVDFLRNAGVFYVLTVDGEQPKGRPFSYFVVRDDKIYFSCGNHKNVFKQIEKNPHVEIMAWYNNEILRYDGMARTLEDEQLRAHVRSASPGIADIYDERGWDYGFFTLEDAHVEIKYLLDPKEEFDL